MNPAPPHGMGAAGYCNFKQHNLDETSLDAKAAAVFDWLLTFGGTRAVTFATVTAVPSTTP